jgi:hypothetical protein
LAFLPPFSAHPASVAATSANALPIAKDRDFIARTNPSFRRPPSDAHIHHPWSLFDSPLFLASETTGMRGKK